MEFVNGEWRFYNSLDKPIPALYVQFIPEEANKSLTLTKLQINGCRLGESSISLQKLLAYSGKKEQIKTSKSVCLFCVLIGCSS